jgi:hypothetical protein
MDMAQTITLKQSDYQKLIDRITKLEKMFAVLLRQIKHNPEYGSDEWWEVSDKKAIEEIKKGNYVAFDSASDMVEYLKNI